MTPLDVFGSVGPDERHVWFSQMVCRACEETSPLVRTDIGNDHSYYEWQLTHAELNPDHQQYYLWGVTRSTARVYKPA